MVTEDKVKVPLSRTARIIRGKERPVIDIVPDTEPGLSFMAQIHSSRGEQGEVNEFFLYSVYLEQIHIYSSSRCLRYIAKKE